MNILHSEPKNKGKVLTGVKHIKIIDNVIVYLNKYYQTIYTTKLSDDITNLTILPWLKLSHLQWLLHF